MSKEDIIRNWKDEAYRDGLSDEERDAMPDNPAGDMSDEELEDVAGGNCPTHPSDCPTFPLPGCGGPW